MSALSHYILLLAKQPQQSRALTALLGYTSYEVAIASSEEQAVAHTEDDPPFLIILAGDHHHWSSTWLAKLRVQADRYRIPLVALTDTLALSWLVQEENPGFDGFLVHPVHQDILTSLVQSAHTRQICLPTARIQSST